MQYLKFAICLPITRDIRLFFYYFWCKGDFARRIISDTLDILANCKFCCCLKVIWVYLLIWFEITNMSLLIFGLISVKNVCFTFDLFGSTFFLVNFGKISGIRGHLRIELEQLNHISSCGLGSCEVKESFRALKLVWFLGIS